MGARPSLLVAAFCRFALILVTVCVFTNQVCAQVEQTDTPDKSGLIKTMGMVVGLHNELASAGSDKNQIPVNGTHTTNQETLESAAKSLPELKAAVDANPKSADALANYATALYQVNKYPESWKQLMLAYKLEPNNTGVALGIKLVSQALEEMGAFTVGVPMEKVRALLGEPSQKVDLGKTRKPSQRWVYGYLAVDFASGQVHELIDLRGATKELFEPTEFVDVDLDNQKWICSLRKKSRDGSSSNFYPAGQTSSSWKENVKIECIRGAANSGSMEEIGQRLIEQISETHPELKHKTLAADSDSMIVALMIPSIPERGFESREQLLRLMKGPVDLHRLAYTIKAEDSPVKNKLQWFRVFKSASLKAVKAKPKPDTTPRSDKQSQ